MKQIFVLAAALLFAPLSNAADAAKQQGRIYFWNDFKSPVDFYVDGHLACRAEANKGYCEIASFEGKHRVLVRIDGVGDQKATVTVKYHGATAFIDPEVSGECKMNSDRSLWCQK